MPGWASRKSAVCRRFFSFVFLMMLTHQVSACPSLITDPCNLLTTMQQSVYSVLTFAISMVPQSRLRLYSCLCVPYHSCEQVKHDLSLLQARCVRYIGIDCSFVGAAISDNVSATGSNWADTGGGLCHCMAHVLNGAASGRLHP